MPKTQRTKKNGAGASATDQCFLIFGEYDRSVEEGSDEVKHNYLVIDVVHTQSFIPREVALFALYQSAVSADSKVIRGSMHITGIQTVTLAQVAIWHQESGILRGAGLDTSTHARTVIPVNVKAEKQA